VLEQAGIGCRSLVDEVSAAQALLRVDDGAVADVGGGSTGVGVFRGGKLVSLSDAPGGGHYLDLILAGALGVSVDEAEERKRGAEDTSAILRAGVERIAEGIRRQLREPRAPVVHLVGGALMLPWAAPVVERWLGVETRAYAHADLVTPFGIAVT
jgi:ethanolamine utilization protein EutJ